jgi:hypothetical protein
MSRYVLIIAPKDDAHAHVVAKRLEALDTRPVILDSATFPTQCQLSLQLANGEPWRFALDNDGIELDDGNLAGVWWRRPRRHLASNEVRESHLRQFVANESREAFEGWLHCLGDRVINPVAADISAANKLLQLQLAVEVGLPIPKSLATNSAARARSFREAVGEEVVFKPFTGADWQFIMTQRLSPDALGHLESVAYAPVIFQQEIQKIADVRVNVLDGEVFPLLIRARRDDSPIDWRADQDREYAVHALPGTVTDALLALMARLRLRFAACDLALTERGDYVFFEANPGGQWLFAEIMTGQAISLAFARALLTPPGTSPVSANAPRRNDPSRRSLGDCRCRA